MVGRGGRGVARRLGRVGEQRPAACARHARPTTRGRGDLLEPDDAAQRDLLARYVAAFEAYDVEALTGLLREDATLSMPPYALWLRGPREVARWLLGHGIGCRGSRLVPLCANGFPAFGQYRPSGPDGRYEPWAVVVLDVVGGRIAGMCSYLDTETLFPLFGLEPSPTVTDPGPPPP